jgi:hypothetical protein
VKVQAEDCANVPLVLTDQADYAPGSTALILGSGFLPNEIVILQVIHTDDVPDIGDGDLPYAVETDGTGCFSAAWYVDPANATNSSFKLTADDVGGLHAETTFTDATPGVDLEYYTVPETQSLTLDVNAGGSISFVQYVIAKGGSQDNVGFQVVLKTNGLSPWVTTDPAVLDIPALPMHEDFLTFWTVTITVPAGTLPGSYDLGQVKGTKVDPNPGVQVGDGHGTNVILNVHPQPNTPPVLSPIPNQTTPWGDLVSFTATATDSDIPAQTLTFSLDAGAPAGASITPDGVFTWVPNSHQLGDNYVTIRVTDNGTPPLSAFETIDILVTPRPTTLVESGSSAQYSDPSLVTATLTDTETGAPISGETINFTLGTQTGSASTINGIAASPIILTQGPGTYTANAYFAGDPCYLLSSASNPSYTIRKEDARATYTGVLFASTASSTSTTATVALSATIQDISALPLDPAYDSYPGDIRNANVTFVNVVTNIDPITLIPTVTLTPIATVPVGLIGTDLKTGSANYNWTTSTGTYTIGVVVGNYYTAGTLGDTAVIQVSTGGGTGFITGGGYLTMAASAGLYPGALGTKANFGFNVKYNKGGTNLQGSMNAIVRNNGQVYQIKANAMQSLSVDSSVTVAHPYPTAVFTAKANITNITDPAHPVSLDNGGNSTLQVTMTDRGEPGSADSIAITLLNKSGGMSFSSDWNGVKTIEQVLGKGAGNLQVHN